MGQMGLATMTALEFPTETADAGTDIDVDSLVADFENLATGSSLTPIQ